MTARRQARPERSRRAQDKLIAVGRIVGLFGVRGELKCDPTSAGRTVISAGAQLQCRRRDLSQSIRIESVRAHKDRLLIRVADVEDAEAAAAYAGATLFAWRADVPLQAGEYFDDDLVGCSVFGKDGAAYGCVERVEHFPSSDMLVLKGGMVPMVGAIVAEIDVERRQILIDPPEGLLG